MKRIAIVGGGISGLAAAYELELARRAGVELDWQLYEASHRLGGIVETTRHHTEAGDFILEGGPDAWVTEKPWARELAVELGLEQELIASQDATRRTYILIDRELQAMPERMRMMVPENLAVLAAPDHSALFNAAALAAYAAEPAHAQQLRDQAPDSDESVASFVLRHFGPEVLSRVAAPLLSGIFGGDVAKLSVRSVMPAFVAMEREHGSLIAAQQARARARGDRPQQPIFTTLRGGLGSLIERLLAQLPPERLHLQSAVATVLRAPAGWLLQRDAKACSECGHYESFDQIVCATGLGTARALLDPIDATAAALLPSEASSAVLVSFCWQPETAACFEIPAGFGFLVPQAAAGAAQGCRPYDDPQLLADTLPQLLACTFTNQKFPGRAPAGARLLRVFFGGPRAPALEALADAAIASAALSQLQPILSPRLHAPLPAPELTTVRRWPRSLPQYEVGHLDRMAALDQRLSQLQGLTLLGNSYRGVGLPDLIHAARGAARDMVKAYGQERRTPSAMPS